MLWIIVSYFPTENLSADCCSSLVWQECIALYTISNITGITSDSCPTQLFLHLYHWKRQLVVKSDHKCSQVNNSIWLVLGVFLDTSPPEWQIQRHLKALKVLDPICQSIMMCEKNKYFHCFTSIFYICVSSFPLGQEVPKTINIRNQGNDVEDKTPCGHLRLLSIFWKFF